MVRRLARRRFGRISSLAVSFLLLWPVSVKAYSVLSHQAVIDAAWDTHLKPALLKRFPNATADELKSAQAYAYGGAIIQDMGYYPYGSPFFSDLTHYVRSGDFIKALLRDAKDINEYGFALGALAHYAADNDGHRIGTNRAVPVLYPELEKKYGNVVTYEQDELAHIKTEFGFDVLQIAKHRYAPKSYHDFIGFAVSDRLLNQAFEETYGLDLTTVLVHEDKVLNSYRRDVSQLIPKATRIAWTLKKDEIQRDQPGITKQKFLYNLRGSNFEKEWGRDYSKPTLGERFLAFLYKLLPKFGPLKVLQFKTPTPETEKMFEESFNATLATYRKLLDAQMQGTLTLSNDNFDVGDATGPGVYRLADETQAKLLDKLAEGQFKDATPEIRTELLAFFGDPDAPYAMKRKAKDWARVQAQLKELKSAGADSRSASSPAASLPQ